MWRIVREKIATLSEIEQFWSFNDIRKAVALLDYESDVSYLASKRRRPPK